METSVGFLVSKGSRHTWKAFLLHWEGQDHLFFLAFRLYHSSQEISRLEAQLGAFHTQVYILVTRLFPAVPLHAGSWCWRHRQQAQMGRRDIWSKGEVRLSRTDWRQLEAIAPLAPHSGLKWVKGSVNWGEGQMQSSTFPF